MSKVNTTPYGQAHAWPLSRPWMVRLARLRLSLLSRLLPWDRTLSIALVTALAYTLTRLAAPPVSASEPARQSAPVQTSQTQVFQQQGLRLSLQAGGLNDSPVRAGTPLQLRFQLETVADQSVNSNSAQAVGKPLRGAFPAAWVHPRADDEQGSKNSDGDSGANDDSAPFCAEKAQTFLGGSLFAQAAADLNGYYVLSMNDDASLSVVDPLFGFGGSKLLTMLPLPAPAYDWVADSHDAQVYLSLPQSQDVLRLDTADWSLHSPQRPAGSAQGANEFGATPQLEATPGRLALQSDNAQLWVVLSSSALARFSTQPFTRHDNLNLSAASSTASAIEQLRFSSDDRYLFAAQGARLQIIDTHQARVVAYYDFPTAISPVPKTAFEVNHGVKAQATAGAKLAIDYSASAQALYVANTRDGMIYSLAQEQFSTWLNQQTQHSGPSVLPETLWQALSFAPGLHAQAGALVFGFAPGGRLGFLLNADNDQLQLIDAATQRVIQQGSMAQGPDQLAFSDGIAYIRHGSNETLYMVALDDPDIGREGAAIAVIDTPAGSQGFAGHAPYSPAASLVPAPGASAMLIAHPGDGVVYYYKEGMAAPMGQFSNYGRQPRAVLAIDHSLREQNEAGVYETTLQLTQAGLHDVVFVLDSPRIVHCFSLDVAAASIPASATAQYWHLQALHWPASLPLGREHHLHFQTSIADVGTANAGELPMITARLSQSAGLWQQQFLLQADAQGQVELAFTAPLAGDYRLRFSAPGLAPEDAAQEHTLWVE